MGVESVVENFEKYLGIFNGSSLSIFRIFSGFLAQI
jgi:hypothetical protein